MAVSEAYSQALKEIGALKAQIRRARQAALQIGRARSAKTKEAAYAKLLRELFEGGPVE